MCKQLVLLCINYIGGICFSLISVRFFFSQLHFSATRSFLELICFSNRKTGILVIIYSVTFDEYSISHIQLIRINDFQIYEYLFFIFK